MIALKVSCFHYSKVDGLTTDTIKFEQALLITRNKEQLKKEAQELNTELTADGSSTGSKFQLNDKFCLINFIF